MRSSGYSSLWSEAQVMVSIKNRNTPIFAQHFHSVRVREDVEVGAVVLTVEAQSPTQKKIIYSISGGSVFNEFDIVFDLGESCLKVKFCLIVVTCSVEI